MATTFQVFYLGTTADIGPFEGNDRAENAGDLIGNTYGGFGDPLTNHIQTLSMGSTPNIGTGYDTNNQSFNETFRINGGADQTMDGLAVYNATITYVDGTTASITAVLFQDTSGKLYLAPEITFDSDQAALEANALRSLTLNSVFDDRGGLFADRVNGSYATCFTSGTAIRTPNGEVLIDTLQVGDLVTTLDNGPQPIRWIGTQPLSHSQLQARPNLRPILIRQGLLGASRNLLVSPQHSMLLGPDTLVRAKHLVDVPKSGIRIAHGKKSITYIHLMFDAHQIIFAEGTASESFYPGPMAVNGLTFSAKAKLRLLFPDVFCADDLSGYVEQDYGATARPILRKSALPTQAQIHRFF